jgi:cholesterol transport system auxiliary component
MRRLLILAAALPLAACISFGADPPPSLLTLTSAERVPAGRSLTADPGRTVTILYPSVPQALATTRVPVKSDATTIAYLKDAQWVEAPNRLFQQLVAETVEARTNRPVLSPRQAVGIDPGARLTGQLVNFGIDAATTSAVVTFDGVIARSATQVETRRFEARVPVSRIEAAPAGIALNQAANQVAVEVADWIGG